MATRRNFTATTDSEFVIVVHAHDAETGELADLPDGTQVACALTDDADRPTPSATATCSIAVEPDSGKRAVLRCVFNKAAMGALEAKGYDFDVMVSEPAREPRAALWGRVNVRRRIS